MAGCHLDPKQAFSLIFGYTDRYLEFVQNLNAAAGSNVLRGTAVPADEVWVVTSMLCFNSNNACTAVDMGVYDGSLDYFAVRVKALAKATPLYIHPHLVMKEGDQASTTLRGCTLNDNIYLHVLGYKMKLTQ